AFAIEPRLVHDVKEPWPTSGYRNLHLHLELDTLAAQYALDVWTDHLEGFGTHYIDDWTANDLVRRQPHELLVCTVTREVTQVTAAMRQSYSSGTQYLAHFVCLGFQSSIGCDKGGSHLIRHGGEARETGQKALVFGIELPRRCMRDHPQHADRL